MTNEDILNGLKSALSRGYSLKEAMYSFYNAGYKKNEIEDAAKALQAQVPTINVLQLQPIQPAKPVVQTESILSPLPKTLVTRKQQTQEAPIIQTQPILPAMPQVQEQKPVEKPETKQIISEYKKTSNFKSITIILLVLLLILLAILGIIFLFKNQIIQFINSLF